MAQRPKFSLLDHLTRHAPLVCDGSIDGPIYDLGFPAASPAFAANMSQPELVKAVHTAYSNAGARVSRSNTAGAHRAFMESLAMADRCEAANNSGSSLMREAVGLRGVFSGRVESITKLLPGTHQRELLESAYGEQFVYLSDTGCWFFMLDEFHDEDDANAAMVAMARNSQKPGILHWRLGSDEDLELAIKCMERLMAGQAEFIGVQLSCDRPHLSRDITRLVDYFGILSCLLDEVPSQEGTDSKGVSEQYSAAVRESLIAGVAILGGGRNTTPEHVAVIDSCLKSLLS